VLKLYTVIGKGCPVTCQVGSEGSGDQLHTSSDSPPREREPVLIVLAADWDRGPVLHMEALCTCGQLLPECNMHVVIIQEMIILISVNKCKSVANLFREMLCSFLGSAVGISTGYGLDGPGIKSRWGRDFPHLSRPALGPTQLPVQGVPDLSRG